mgnify:CR=1 FL=1
MITMTRILCPVDFSDASKHALTHAVALARWYNARLTVQHVYRIAIPAAALSPGMGSIGAEAVMMATVDEGALRADRKSTRLNSSHSQQSRMPSSA